MSRHESDTAPRLVRKDVGHLEMLMNAAVTADKLRRAYRLAKVHEELVDVVTGVKWNEIGFDLNSVTIKGEEYKVVRLQWLPRIEPGGELHEDE